MSLSSYVDYIDEEFYEAETQYFEYQYENSADSSVVGFEIRLKYMIKIVLFIRDGFEKIIYPFRNGTPSQKRLLSL